VERGLSLGILALIGWGVAMGVAMIIGKAVSDGSTTFLMLLIAAGAFVYGRRLRVQPPSSQPKAREVVAIALWAGAGLLTLVALVTLGAD
jgi:drug/metabolite transporter (DMT)-like permease